MKMRILLFALFITQIAFAQESGKRDFPNYTSEIMGENINSPDHHDIIPVVSDDNELLYFGRRNDLENDGGVKDKIDIWWLKREGDDWGADLHHMESKLNNNGFNFISSNFGSGWDNILLGAILFDDITKSGFSTSTYDGEFWSKPEKQTIENWYNNDPEVHYNATEDEDIIIVSADRDDSQGAKDLYVIKKTTNEEGEVVWTEPMNLGNINSTGDDVSSFMDFDNKMLYFSTDGRGGEGSYDVFRSERLDDTWTNWSEPENLGTGVNTSESEMYFVIAKADDYAYFSRGEKTGENGDIWRTELLDLSEVTVCGIVRDSVTNEPLAAASVVATDSKGNVVATVESDSDGKYCVTLDAGDEYALTPRKEGYYAKDFFITIPEFPESSEMEMDLLVPPIEAGMLDVIVYFDFDKYEFSPSYFDRLNELNQELSRYVGAKVRLQGHTDYRGAKAYNQGLSERRAQAIADYLFGLGLSKDNVIVEGFGEDQPAVDERTAEARAKNRRVEVVIEKE